MKVIRLENVIKVLKEYSDFKGQFELLDKASSAGCSCCYCSICKHHHDDCVCMHNEIVEWLLPAVIDI
jgi:hypothetical protein